jgi:uncharacterized protein YegP (UPF0339 family)
MKLTLIGDKAVEWLEEQFGFEEIKKPKTSNMKFVIERSKNKQFYFNLIARNGRIVMTSETYRRKGSCEKAIASMIRNVMNSKTVDKTV